MANWNGLQLTNKGIALQAKVQAGTQLHITKLKLGSGVVPSGTDIKTLTDLITPEQNLGIGGKEAIDDYCKISSTISNTELETGYYVRELGVFAQDPDEGEILYLYTTDGAPDYLPAGGGSTVISQEFSVMIAVDDTDNILVDIDPAALATMGYVQLQIQEHNTDTTAHADFTGATAETAGKRGMVPAPAAGDQNKALFGDATYKQVVQKVNGVVADSAGNVTIDIPEPVIASEAEAKAGTNNTKFMTPLRVAQAIEEFAPVKSVNGVGPDEDGNIQINDIYTQPNLTLLWKADISQEYYKGDITLSEAYTNYKALLIETVCQTSFFVGTEIVPVWELQYRKSMKIMASGQKHNGGFFLTNGEEYYILNAQQSTTTFLKFVTSHGYLRAIYGIK